MSLTSSVLPVVLLLARAPGTPPTTPAPSIPKAPSAPAATSAAEPETAERGPTGTASGEYRIGPGDVLQVAVYGHKDLDQTVIVQPDGTFLFPLIGAVPASRATTGEVEERIAALLAKGFIRDAHVTVTVQQYRSQVVYVVGQVSRPGTYPLAGETRIVEILARAGPLTRDAGSEVLVVRPGGNVGRPVLPAQVSGGEAVAAAGGGSAPAQVLHVDVPAIEAGHLDQNIVLEPNDTVFVPVAEQVFITGEVRNPGAFAFHRGLTARQAVALAGGFTEDAAKGSAQVVREVGGGSKTLKLGLDERLLPGDTVVIKKAWF